MRSRDSIDKIYLFLLEANKEDFIPTYGRFNEIYWRKNIGKIIICATSKDCIVILEIQVV